MTNVQGLVCVKDDVSREHRVVEDRKQEENASARTYDWAEVFFGTV